ncbi:MAG TPA: alpha/beta hydrolase [Candidatus Aquabacterium excrementipullorum]|nr:alpha/beta hydrolase [Candidatus Aquabacterium excrementipullorum]
MNAASTAPAHATIVFSHANSFPAGTYEALFEHWRAQGYQVRAVERFGHDPRYPVTRDWPHLVRHLHDVINDDIGHPVYLVGHSLGGYLSMMLACRHPQLARGVVVLDSPLLHGWKADSIGMVKALGLMPVVMPSRVAAQRRHLWSSAGEAREHFQAKPKFAAFHPRVLADYLRHGIEAPPGGHPHTLRFQREVETHIYNTMPHRLTRELLRYPLQCPIAFVAGTRSRELRQVGLGAIRHVVGPRLSWIQGSHLYPFERPDETASVVLDWLRQFREDQGQAQRQPEPA